MSGKNKTLTLGPQAERNDARSPGERGAADDVAKERSSLRGELRKIGVGEHQAVPTGTVVLTLVARAVRQGMTPGNGVLERRDVVLRLRQVRDATLDQERGCLRRAVLDLRQRLLRRLRVFDGDDADDVGPDRPRIGR